MKKTHKLPALAFLLVPICIQGWSRANLLPLPGSVAHLLHLLFARYPSCYEREAGEINLLGLVCTWKHCPCPNPREECRGYILSPDTPGRVSRGWGCASGSRWRGCGLGGHCWVVVAHPLLALLSPDPLHTSWLSTLQAQSRAPRCWWALILPRTTQHYQPMLIHLGSTSLCTHDHSIHSHAQKSRSGGTVTSHSHKGCS